MRCISLFVNDIRGKREDKLPLSRKEKKEKMGLSCFLWKLTITEELILTRFIY